MNTYELMVQKIFGEETAETEKTASMTKQAGFDFGSAIAEGFYYRLAELVKEAQDASQQAAPAAAPAAPMQAAPAANIADQATATQKPVDNAINVQATVEAPNPGNDYINSSIKSQVQAFLQMYANDPARLQAALAQMSPDQIAALMKIPEIADKIKPLLTAAPTSTGPVNVPGTNTPDPANTPGATPAV